MKFKLFWFAYGVHACVCVCRHHSKYDRSDTYYTRGSESVRNNTRPQTRRIIIHLFCACVCLVLHAVLYVFGMRATCAGIDLTKRPSIVVAVAVVVVALFFWGPQPAKTSRQQ